jgi:hypothetical protein
MPDYVIWVLIVAVVVIAVFVWRKSRKPSGPRP